VKLGLIGCGFMGEAMLSATIGKHVVQPGDVFVAEVNDERCSAMSGRYGVRVTSNPAEVIDASEVVVFAVKPQEFDRRRASRAGAFRREADHRLDHGGRADRPIARMLTHAAIVRVMPNTPAAVGEGMSVWTATPEVDGAAREQVGAILGAMGREVHVDDEKYLDMATALSGSGPGFVYMLLEAFIDAGVHVGFKRNVAEMLALQTFVGSAKYAEATGKHPAELRNEVTSPAGTTAAGLLVLESAGVRGAIIDAIEAAYERSRELGRVVSSAPIARRVGCLAGHVSSSARSRRRDHRAPLLSWFNMDPRSPLIQALNRSPGRSSSRSGGSCRGGHDRPSRRSSRPSPAQFVSGLPAVLRLEPPRLALR
jgi:pyrroline-5-carboxylate reductase